ncbi:MAG: FHA domain-containing protein [Desulfobacterales bacterium]|nr:FHA domain-containing protein [Desulfobacterales bacterium]
MTKETEKAAWRDKADTEESLRDKEFGHASTAALPRKAFMGELPIKQRACLEIIGARGKSKVIELGEGELTIGRSPGCAIQLRRSIVSRSHARITFRNEDYHLEDLGSTNGTYVNGIKVERCILRNNDQIDIGGVKMLFSEEKTLQKL